MYTIKKEFEEWQYGSVVKNPPANAGDTRDMGSIPGLGRFSGIGNGSPLQYSCLENSMDRGTWWATVHGRAKSQTQLTTHALFYTTVVGDFNTLLSPVNRITR